MPAQTNFTQVADPSLPGQCCDCKKQVGCGCGPPPCELNCQERSSPSGFATFCGFAEYGTPSDPPLYYRTMTLSGTVTINCGDSSCAGMSPCSQTLGYSGTSKFDQNTCVQTTTSVFTSAGSCCTQPPLPRTDIIASDIEACGIATFGISDVFTTTTHTLMPNNPGACIPGSSGFSACVEPGSISCEASLTDLDQTDDAIARAVAGQPWLGQDCSTNFSFLALWGPGIREFAFRQARVNATLFNTSPGHSYQVTITLKERAVGSVAPLSPFGLIQFDLTAPPSGNPVSDYHVIPNVAGLEIHATDCTVLPIGS